MPLPALWCAYLVGGGCCHIGSWRVLGQSGSGVSLIDRWEAVVQAEGREWQVLMHPDSSVPAWVQVGCCSKIAEAEAAVSVNEKKWLVMHMHVQLKLDELRGPPNPWLLRWAEMPST